MNSKETGWCSDLNLQFDLAWKVIKDFLEEKGFAFKPSPKDTIRQAAAAGYIDYAQELIDGLDIRNELSHDYSGDKFEQSEEEIRQAIFTALRRLNQFFAEQLFVE